VSIFGVWIRPMFEPRDLWIGAYVKEPYWEMGWRVYGAYLCVVPCFPVLVSWRVRGTQ
jgi:hypothetical protein